MSNNEEKTNDIVSNKSESQNANLGFAPDAPTDGRQLYDWQSRWPVEARKRMRAEFVYLIVFLIGPCVVLTMHFTSTIQLIPELLGALAGIAGGSAFSSKWFYHSIAKGLWHVDRCYWRIITPLISGVIAFFAAILVRSEILNIFKAETFAKPANMIILGFIAGYFSDSAIAKFAEVAASLFGQTSSKKD